MKRPTDIRLLLIILSTYAALGAACAISFAFIRCAFAKRYTPAMPYVFGYGPTSTEGTVWMWVHSATLGWHVCRSDVYDASAQRQIITPMGPIGWYEGPAPWWSIAAEQPYPPTGWRPATSTGIHAVLDNAFGWPIPCARYREYQITRQPTSAEIAAMGLKSDGTQYIEQTLLLGSPRFAGWWSTLGINDGYWPTNILWRGLAANTIALGMILALPHACFLAFRAYRSRARRRSGKCPWCGYDRGGLTADTRCPECGGVEPSQR